MFEFLAFLCTVLPLFIGIYAVRTLGRDDANGTDEPPPPPSLPPAPSLPTAPSRRGHQPTRHRPRDHGPVARRCAPMPRPASPVLR
ncbi:MAG: hypothetical protein ACR2GR_07180 [Rhodothermales bacterium]